MLKTTATLGVAVSLLVAAPMAHGSARLFADADGTVTMEWPENACGGGDDPIVLVDNVEAPEAETFVDDPDAPVEWAVAELPVVPVRPWRLVYRTSGEHETWYDDGCAPGEVEVDPLGPTEGTLLRAARASHRAKVKAARSRARRHR